MIKDISRCKSYILVRFKYWSISKKIINDTIYLRSNDTIHRKLIILGKL